MSACVPAPSRRAAAVGLSAVLLALGAMTSEARAGTFYDVTLDMGLRDDARVFLNVTNDYFAPPPAVAVDIVKRCRVPEDDYPVILFLARASRRPAVDILRMRMDYLSWSDIMFRLRVQPSVLFVGIDRDPGPPYGKAWGYWKKHPRGEAYSFRDRDVVELTKLQIASRYHRVSPYTVVAERNRGVTVEHYVAERSRGKYGKRSAPRGATSGGGEEKQKGQGHDKSKGQGKPKGHGKPHDHP